MLCLDSKWRKSRVLRRAPGRRLRAPRLHHQRRPAVQAGVQGRRDDRRAAAARDRARPRGQGARAARAPADPPDRVRDPELAGQDLRRLARAPGGLPRGGRAHRLRQPARRVVLAVPDERRPAALQRLPLRGVRERPAAGRRAAEAGVRGLPAPARGRGLRAQRRAVGSRAAAARRDQGDDRAPHEGRRGRCSRRWTRPRPASTRSRPTHRSGQRYRVRWTAPDGQTYTGPSVRGYS